MVLHTSLCTQFIHIFFSFATLCSLELTSETQKLRPKAKWLTQSHTIIVEMKLWFKSKPVPFWWQNSTFVPQSPASPWCLLSIRWKHVWFLLPLCGEAKSKGQPGSPWDDSPRHASSWFFSSELHAHSSEPSRSVAVGCVLSCVFPLLIFRTDC